MPHEYTVDGYWLPHEPGGTPGWGGVRFFACRSCGVSTDYFIPGERITGGWPPQFCRKCLLAGKRPEVDSSSPQRTQVLAFIATVRESFPLATTVYTHGSCYRFFLILKQVWPEAVCYTNIDHCITKIGHTFYDITGEVEVTGYWVPITDDPALEARQAQHVWTGRTNL